MIASAVRRYLAQFLHDYRVVEMTRWLWCPILHFIILPLRAGKVAKKYASIWTSRGSPLLVLSQDLTAAVQVQLPEFEVRLAMRYGEPSVASVLRSLQAAGMDRLAVMPLYPQYAASTTASSHDAVLAELRTWREMPQVRMLKDYHLDEAWLEALAQSVRAHWASNGRGERLLMSFHGLPQRLIAADAVVYQAAHISRAQLLVEVLDPSVSDELVPDRRIVELDIYDSKNPNQPSYDKSFIAAYRAAQLQRMRRITAWVKDTLEELQRRNTQEMERGFVVHRTLADPRFLDPALDPNDRKPRWCYLGNPETVNTGPVGLARFCTLRSWLSQWSVEDSKGDGVACVKTVTAPLLVIENSADDAAPQTHPGLIYAAAGSSDKQMRVIKGANHYYAGQPELLAEAVSLIGTWMQQRKLQA